MSFGEQPNEPGSHPVPVARMFNGRKKSAFLIALATTGTMRGAAARIGIGIATAYEHAKKDPTFAEAIERARGEWEQRQMERIDKAADVGKVIERRDGTRIEEAGDWRASAWALEHSPNTRERYAAVQRNRVEMGGSDELPPIQMEQTTRVEIGPDTLSRLEQVIVVLARAGKLRLPEPGEVIDVSPVDDDG